MPNGENFDPGIFTKLFQYSGDHMPIYYGQPNRLASRERVTPVGTSNRIQGLLDKSDAPLGTPPRNPNDPDAPDPTKMQGEFARDPAADIRAYIALKNHGIFSHLMNLMLSK